MVMMTIWKSLIQSKVDYCSQLWSPTGQSSISKLESIARQFTAQIAGLKELDYWDRLKSLRLYSQERRRERYRILFIWKVLQGYTKGYTMNSMESPRRGRLVIVPNYSAGAPSAVKRAKEASLAVQGAQLFNIIPRHLRDIKTGTVDQFKTELDSWLTTLPDQPTIPGRLRAAQTNSLLHQVTQQTT